jgi:hypothetical protein
MGAQRQRSPRSGVSRLASTAASIFASFHVAARCNGAFCLFGHAEGRLEVARFGDRVEFAVAGAAVFVAVGDDVAAPDW